MKTTKKIIITLTIEEEDIDKLENLIERAKIVQERQDHELCLLDGIYEIVNDPIITEEIVKTETFTISLN